MKYTDEQIIQIIRDRKVEEAQRRQLYVGGIIAAVVGTVCASMCVMALYGLQLLFC